MVLPHLLNLNLPTGRILYFSRTWVTVARSCRRLSRTLRLFLVRRTVTELIKQVRARDNPLPGGRQRDACWILLRASLPGVRGDAPGAHCLDAVVPLDQD